MALSAKAKGKVGDSLAELLANPVVQWTGIVLGILLLLDFVAPALLRGITDEVKKGAAAVGGWGKSLWTTETGALSSIFGKAGSQVAGERDAGDLGQGLLDDISGGDDRAASDLLDWFYGDTQAHVLDPHQPGI